MITFLVALLCLVFLWLVMAIGGYIISRNVFDFDDDWYDEDEYQEFLTNGTIT